ncbi:unnamed protein product (macronuclear) [Paramecium tetraurelia]|uniref:Peptidase M14 domain-containing protein n=1 Tax=Paramecium tetraurelia TaxID=5888 RepID=A0DNW1_PARTE|nr:uncharacterized protein GSPATT00018924001 [Paramecium tetraurelia]CAK84728.1 unnamed protein product [Paramecium tetraurelia]|eukprot:XP_001452125.1 hypothetical protein (macronuclear) [Paramecium tetraurelia strain d4-2]
MIFILLVQITQSLSIHEFLELTPFQIQKLKTETLQDYFISGSIQGYLGLTEYSQLIDKLANSFPNQVSLRSFGNTYQGTQIKTIQISTTKSPKYSIAIIGMLGGCTDLISVNYLLYQLYFITIQLSNKNPFMMTLLSDKQLLITPLINADGLQYITTQYIQTQTMPLIFKNRNPSNSNKCSQNEIGVDLSRNFQYKFGINEIGSSSNQCSQIYRGRNAFSEPETLAIDKLVQQIRPNILIVIGGDLDKLVIPDSNSSTYQQLLYQVSKEYNLKMGDHQTLYQVEINGDLCQNYIYQINNICYTINIGQYALNQTILNFQNLLFDVLSHYSPSLQIQFQQKFNCQNGKMLCNQLESNEKGCVIIISVQNVGYNQFNDNIVMDITLNQGGEKLYQIDSYVIAQSIKNTSDSSLKNGIQIDETSTDRVYRYQIVNNRRLNQNQTIYFVFLLTQFGFSYNYINTVESIDLTFSLENTLLNSLVYQTLTPSDLAAKNSKEQLQRIFPNRPESYVLLICFAAISVVFLFSWIIRKMYIWIYDPHQFVEENKSKLEGSSDDKNLEQYKSHNLVESRLTTQVKLQQVAPIKSLHYNESLDQGQPEYKGINGSQLLPHLNPIEIENRVHKALEIVKSQDDLDKQEQYLEMGQNMHQNQYYNIQQQNQHQMEEELLVNTPNIQQYGQNEDQLVKFED